MELIELLEKQVLNVENAADKNAAISDAFKTIRTSYKLDLQVTYTTHNTISFVYKIENTSKSVFITGIAYKTPRTWKEFRYNIF